MAHSESLMKNFVKAESPVDRKQIESGVRALFEYVEKKATDSKKTELFADEERPIFLQITAIKVPNTPNRQIRFMLQHSMLTGEGEVCLIVKDMFKAKQHEETIEYFEDLFRENGVTGIKTILPFHQFKTEYGHEVELKRKLLGLYDHFLVDARISGYVVHLLGKIYLEKRKMPTPVNMDKGDLKERIDRALRKTLMKIHSKSDSFQVQVGHVNMSQEQVYENVMAVVEELDNNFPGGLDNVRALGVKTDKSISIPVYLTLKNKSTVNVPLAIPKLPKAFRNVTGELSTYAYRDVTVLPSGEVIIHGNRRKNEDINADEDLPLDSDDKFPEEDDSEVVDGGKVKEEVLKIQAKTTKSKKIKAEDAIKDEDVAGDVLAQAEEMYLNEYEQEQSLNKKKNKNKKKQKAKENVSDTLDDSKIINEKKFTQENRQKKGANNKKFNIEEAEETIMRVQKGVKSKNSKKNQIKQEMSEKNIKVEAVAPKKRKSLQVFTIEVSPSKILKKEGSDAQLQKTSVSTNQQKGTGKNKKAKKLKQLANGIEIKQVGNSPTKKKKGDGKASVNNATLTKKSEKENLKNQLKKGKRNSNTEILKVKIRKSMS